MRDSNNNEANFDFLDYTDSKGEPLATLYETATEHNIHKSIFPKGSYNNKLTVYDLKGTVLKDKIIDNNNTNIVDFQFEEDKPLLVMHDNFIECRGLVITTECRNFCNNIIKEAANLKISSDINASTLCKVYTVPTLDSVTSFFEVEDNSIFNVTSLYKTISNVTINEFVNSMLYESLTDSTFQSIKNTSIYGKISNSTFESLLNCSLYGTFDYVQFKSLTDCTVNTGTLVNIKCHSDITNYTFDSSVDVLLYDITKIKEVYFEEGELKVYCPKEHYFARGMIMMYSGLEDIPYGWAVCDGQVRTFNGKEIVTPDLRNKFIKAVTTAEEVKATVREDLTEDNEFILKEEHLPEHHHPHKEHTHTISEIQGVIENSGDLQMNFDSSDYVWRVTDYHMDAVVGVSGEGVTDVSTNQVMSSTGTNTQGGSVSGGNHTHNITISGGEIFPSTSEEDVKTWENKPIKIEPNYYSLIFIIKL